MERARRTAGTLSSLLLALAALLALLVLSGCRTVHVTDERETLKGTATLLMDSLPPVPMPPEAPELEWQYEENGRFSISASDADRFLEWRDNGLGEHALELEKYQRLIDSIREIMRERDL